MDVFSRVIHLFSDFMHSSDGLVDSLSALGLLACIIISCYGKIQRQTLTRSYTYNPQAVLAFPPPPRSSLSHTPKWLLVFLLQVRPSLAPLHTQQSKSPEMIWSDQRVRIIHSASVGLFCIPDSQCDWIFHLHTRLLYNVTHTPLKQHCHSLLASSIFPYWHFLFCLEQE